MLYLIFSSSDIDQMNTVANILLCVIYHFYMYYYYCIMILYEISLLKCIIYEIDRELMFVFSMLCT
jgi:hypothetical protein